MTTIENPAERGTHLDPLPVYLDARTAFANSYLLGDGLEIGPLHQPLAVPPHAHVRYVDRMTSQQLRSEYPELADWDLTEVDIVDDGEKLTTIPAESQDFIIANHFLEHTENPIGTIEGHLGKLKPGGVLFYAVPDKRFTFDFRRETTPLEHMVADADQGPERSRAQHYEEWCRFVIGHESGDEVPSDEWVTQRAAQLDEMGYSIHMHVWTQAEFLDLILEIRRRTGAGFDIEAAARVGIEFVVVLRKPGALPVPPTPPAPPPQAPLWRVWGSRAKWFARRTRERVNRRRARP
ncbi:MAG TPA: methyltransferase domain-containing protein [Solirubrobacterales bacterium]|jgi:SAM-dependent methyltransferase|nr:methyltransferase domain-containing protein [Solirubrobacterales bacterium]